MTKPLLIVSLPNSGTTWLTAVLDKCGYGPYVDEFFNPVLNHKHEMLLRQHFGSELACCYNNIASEGHVGTSGFGPGKMSTLELVQTLWPEGTPGFTKENYSPFKLPVLNEHFRCVVLLRHTSGTFPPSRVRVWSFYEHAWQALKERSLGMHEVTLRARAMEAHAFMARHLRNSALDLGVPIIYYEDLFDDDRMPAQLTLAGLTAGGVIDEIRATRRPKRIDWGAVY